MVVYANMGKHSDCEDESYFYMKRATATYPCEEMGCLFGARFGRREEDGRLYVGLITVFVVLVTSPLRSTPRHASKADQTIKALRAQNQQPDLRRIQKLSR